MKRMQMLVTTVLATSAAIGFLGNRGAAAAEDPLKAGKILQRTELAGAKGMEAILVLRDLPPGGESGKHTQSGNEVVYVLDGSITLEVQGKPAVTLKAGDVFQTDAGEVHNVKNASATAPGKALVFYVAKKGTGLEGLSTPVK